MPPRRPKPYSQGDLKAIYQAFIRPMIRLRPEGMNVSDWLDALFCVDDRFIYRFKAKDKFNIPGLYWAAPQRLFPGAGARNVNAGSEVWVRKDLTMPDRIDVEVFNGVGGKNHVYALTRHEFDKISIHLVDYPFPKRKREKMSWEQKP